MHGFHLVLVILGVGALMASASASAQTAAKAPRPSESGQRMAQIEELQRAIDEEIGLLRAQIQGLEARLNEIQDILKEADGERAEDREQLKAMREEVRGLYVESSSTKELIGNLGEQVDNLGGALERFRFGAGILLAALVVLQGIGIALTFRARG